MSDTIKSQSVEANFLEPRPPIPELSRKPRLLIVEDDEDVRSQMKWAMMQDYEILTAGDRTEAMAAIRAQQPRVVILDLGLPPHPASTEEAWAKNRRAHFAVSR